MAAAAFGNARHRFRPAADLAHARGPSADNSRDRALVLDLADAPATYAIPDLAAERATAAMA
ncbi:hypothetical protein FOH10_28145 [Nocardia otitidiscaviarum]|uniref:Uncharacterized protein n=1 Tax=Nocardia otitidiscaviarum TaxID=1823 RepID=A0A516NT00_9NOCA|nr:hypothetical protein [Nocardia otitidiscaviarum]MCP9621304.1 hypothetical protein [Nocardia otitidiscaviarum]QDP82027.1 hypothetical protein FOH10_28145 [Nocardia otitidiscaviarum]